MRLKADYGWWLTASTADMLARSLRDIAIPITVFYLSDDIRLSGMVESLGQLAFLLTMLIGGRLADSRNRRALMVGRGVSGSLLWIAVAILIAFGMLPIWVLVAAVVVNSALDGLLGFGDNAALRSILPDNEMFARAQGVNQARNSIISVAGGPLGGVLYASAVWLPYLMSSVLMALLALGAKMIKANLDPGAERVDDGSVESPETETVRTVRQGLTYVMRHPTLRNIALCVMFLNAGLSLALGVHIYTRINAGESAIAVAGVSAVFSLAMVAGSLPVSRVLVSARTGLLIRVLLGAITAALIVAGLFGVSPEGLGALAVCGFLTPSLNGALVGYMFAITPVGLQGRVASILAFVELFISAAVPLVVSGLVARELSGTGLAVAAGFMGAAWLVTLLSAGIGGIAKPGAWSDEG